MVWSYYQIHHNDSSVNRRFILRKSEGAVKKRKFFYSSFLGDREKRCRTDKLSKIKASDLILLARRRTRVRRVAKFVRSIKHNFFINFRFPIFLKGSIGLFNLQNPLLYPVLYGLRFFYIPLFDEILINNI